MDEKSRNIKNNIVISFIVKGCAVVVSMITVPQYMSYFGSESLLGVWYTILNIITWITMFDLGIGNGLRNKLTDAFTKKDIKREKELISSTYIFTSVFSIVLTICCIVLSTIVNWNRFLNIDEKIIELSQMKLSMAIVLGGVCLHFLTKLVTSILYAEQKSALVGTLVACTTEKRWQVICVAIE